MGRLSFYLKQKLILLQGTVRVKAGSWHQPSVILNHVILLRVADSGALAYLWRIMTYHVAHLTHTFEYESMIVCCENFCLSSLQQSPPKHRHGFCSNIRRIRVQTRRKAEHVGILFIAIR